MYFECPFCSFVSLDDQILMRLGIGFLYIWVRRGIGISGSLIWSKTLMELIFNPVVNFGEVRRDIFRSFTVFSDAVVRVGCGEQRKATALFIPSKTAILVPKFAVEDLPWAEYSDGIAYIYLKITSQPILFSVKLKNSTSKY